jgi:hypothetical protein
MYSCTISLISAINGGGWSKARSGRFTRANDLIPIVQEAGRAPGPVWIDAENLALTGIRSSDRLVRITLWY